MFDFPELSLALTFLQSVLLSGCEQAESQYLYTLQFSEIGYHRTQRLVARVFVVAVVLFTCDFCAARAFASVHGYKLEQTPPSALTSAVE